MLLQRPSKWTPRHLEVANLKATEDVPAAEIVADYVPKDGDPGSFALLLNEPSLSDRLSFEKLLNPSKADMLL